VRPRLSLTPFKGKEKEESRNTILLKSSWQRSLKDALCGLRKINQAACGVSLVCLIFDMVIPLGR